MDIAEQLCYIPCNFCNIILAVSVPCNSLFDVVTVRCGHCSNLWTVNMAAAAFHYQHHPSWQDLQIPSYSSAVGSSPRWNFMMPLHPPTFINKLVDKRLSNRPPEKRQRVPSAYNQFIKEEIQRIKANNPNITHREAFSTAAKNWAHFPHIHFGLMLETSNQDKPNEGTDKRQIRRPSVLP